MVSLSRRMGRGGSSSGSTSDYRSRGPRFNSCREMGFFSSLLYPFKSVSLIRYLVEVQNFWFSKIKMLSCAAWGETSLIHTDWERKVPEINQIDRSCSVHVAKMTPALITPYGLKISWLIVVFFDKETTLLSARWCSVIICMHGRGS